MSVLSEQEPLQALKIPRSSLPALLGQRVRCAPSHAFYLSSSGII